MKNLITRILKFYLRRIKPVLDSIKGDLSFEKYKDKFQKIGNQVYFNGEIFISAPDKVSIGNNVHIGNNAYFKTEGGLSIGDNTHISRNVTIYTCNHNYEGSALPYDNSMVFKKVDIKKNVWIGMNVSIIPGVTIGEGAIIGMGTIISKEIPPFCIVGSAPMRIIKERNKEHYKKLERAKSFGGRNGKLLKKED